MKKEVKEGKRSTGHGLPRTAAALLVLTSLSCDADETARGISGVSAADAGVSDCNALGASAATMRGGGGAGRAPPLARFM